MFDTLYAVRWINGEPQLLTGHQSKNRSYANLSDGSITRNNRCGRSPLAAIEQEILQIAATQARDHQPIRSKRAWTIARLIQKLCHLAKTVRQQNQK